VNAQTGTTYTVAASDTTKIVTFSNASPVAVTLPSGLNFGFGIGSVFSIKNIGAGTVTVACSSCTITGSGAPSSVLALSTGQGADIYSDGTNYVAQIWTGGTLGSQPISLGTAFTSDTIRFNEYSDGKWDIVPGAPRTIQVISDGSNNPFSIGHNNQPSTVGTRSLVGSSTTESPSLTYASSAVASVNVTAGIHQAYDGSGNGLYTFGSTYHYATRFRMNQTTNCRFWLGMLGHQSLSATNFATDTPNHKYAGFRYSAGTDSHIVAAVGIATAAQTVVDTGVAVDTTNSQLFEIIRTGPIGVVTGFVFKINGTVVATITTNVPASSDTFGFVSFYGDNQNTGNVVSGTHWYSTLMLK